MADVSAVADPNTGVAVFAPNGSGGSAFLVFGGTSVAAPIIASIYALNGGTVTFGSDPYAHTSSLFDVTSTTARRASAPERHDYVLARIIS